jgi:hypothetical protein
MKKEISHDKMPLSLNSAVLIGASSGAMFGSYFGFYGGLVGMGLGILLLTCIKFFNL